MTPDIVVDIGNSRIKWGWGTPMGVASLAPDDEPAWDRQLVKLGLMRPLTWAVAGVHPARLERFAAWATARGDHVRVLTHADIPLKIDVDEPAKVGIDRLLGAVAAYASVRWGTPAVTVDVGTAVTVNLIDGEGTFVGGAIFPGPRLMGLSLHQYTAKLPLVEVTGLPDSPFPGKNTASAIRFGIESAVVGGTDNLIFTLVAICPKPPQVYLTGGGAGLFAHYQPGGVAGVQHRPALNLDGIRIAAEGVP